jgi:hypothetical protein
MAPDIEARVCRKRSDRREGLGRVGGPGVVGVGDLRRAFGPPLFVSAKAYASSAAIFR